MGLRQSAYEAEKSDDKYVSIFDRIAAKTVKAELIALATVVETKFEKFDELGEPVDIFEEEPLKLVEDDVIFNVKATEYGQFLHGYEIPDVQSLCEALRTQLREPTSFDTALLELPPKLVCMIVMLGTLNKYELVHAAVNEILSKAKPDSKLVYCWSLTLHKLLSEQFPQWYESLKNSLDHVLSHMIDKREAETSYPLSWCHVPLTIEEGFYKCVWPGLELFYYKQAKMLPKDQLNKVMIIAAQNGYEALFKHCLRQGADFHKVIKVHLMRTETENGEVHVKTSEHSALHYILRRSHYHHLDLEQLEWPEGSMDIINYRDSSRDTLLHLAIFGQQDLALRNVQFLMKHGADVNITCNPGKTAIQRLLNYRGRRPKLYMLDLLLIMVKKAHTVDPQNWDSQIPALHVLCQFGKCEYIPLFISRGANELDLWKEKTLIDTVVQSFDMPLDAKEKTLAALLNSPLRLGPYHASEVDNRFCEGKMDLIPLSVVHLLLPPISTKQVQKSHLRMIKMLMEEGAVCESELLAITPHLRQAERENYHEAVEYLRPVIAAFTPVGSQSTS